METVLADKRTFLHVGCGAKRQDQAGPGFQTAAWHEIRLDIDPRAEPDVIGSITDMAMVETDSMDALFSSHNIEHVYPHEVSIALREFLRVLKPQGYCVITCPDLQSVAALIVDDKLDDPAYVSPAGPICPIDILYGLRKSVAAGNHFMAHKCGFTRKTLIQAMSRVGFRSVIGRARPRNLDLWALGTKSPVEEEVLRSLASIHFPR